MPIVLVVEDDSDLLPILTEALAAEGWMVLCAASAAGALQIARSRHVDVVLTDVRMPDGDGLDLESTFKAIPMLSCIPFVLMTGSPPDMIELRGRSVLFKPFGISDASAALAASLQREEPTFREWD